jgi:hypothetical protein
MNIEKKSKVFLASNPGSQAVLIKLTEMGYAVSSPE